MAGLGETRLCRRERDDAAQARGARASARQICLPSTRWSSATGASRGIRRTRRSSTGFPPNGRRLSGTAARPRPSVMRCLTRRCSLAAATWPPDVRDADLVVNATSERDDVLAEVGLRADADRPAVPGDGDRARGRGGRRRGRHRPRRSRRAGRGLVRALDGPAGSGRRDAPRSTLRQREHPRASSPPASRTGPRSWPSSPACRQVSCSTARRSTPTCAAASRATGAARASRSRPTRWRCSPACATAARSARRSRSSSATRITRTGPGA